MRRVTFVLLACLFLAPAISRSAELPEGDWKHIQLGKVEILTNVKTGRAVKIAEHVARLEEWLAIFSVVEPEFERPRRLFLFRDVKTFEPYQPIRDGKRLNVAGYLAVDMTGVYLALDESSQEDPLQVLYPEYTYAYLGERLPLAPSWVTEGIAALHTNFEIHDDDIVVGKAIPELREVLREGRAMDFSRFVIEDGAKDVRTSDPNSVDYAQAWGTLHYLLTHKEARVALKDYLERIHAGEPEDFTFHATLEPLLPDASSQLKEYASQRKMPHFELKRPAKYTEDDATVRDLSEAELHAELGTLLVHSPLTDTELARAHFDAALALDPANRRAQAGRAYERQKAGDEAAAMQMLRDLPELDAVQAILLGDLLRAEHRRRNPSGRATDSPELVDEALALYQHALESAPHSPAALFGEGVCHYMQLDQERARPLLERAVQLAPWESAYAYFQVLNELDAGEVSKARNAFETHLKPVSRPRARFELQVRLVRAEIEEANRLSAEGDPAAASLLLAETRRLAEGNQVVDLVDRSLARLDFDEHVRRYQAAQKLVLEGELEQAKEQLDRLRSEDLNESVAEAVERLYSVVDRRLSR